MSYVFDDGCCPHGKLHVCPPKDCGDHYIAGYKAAVQAVYGQLVDRLWGCDHDANGVLNLVESLSAGDKAEAPR